MPRPGTPLVHKTLLAKLAAAGWYPDSVTIQVNTPTRSGTGDLVEVWANLADHVGLACRMAVNAPAGARGDRSGELRRSDGTVVTAGRTIALAGNYPTITTEHRAVIDSTNFDILAVESDAQARSTYLLVEAVT